MYSALLNMKTRKDTKTLQPEYPSKNRKCYLARENEEIDQRLITVITCQIKQRNESNV